MDETLDTLATPDSRPGGHEVNLVLVLAWVADEPDRIGEILVLPDAARGGRRARFGRGAGDCDRLVPCRQRPASLSAAPPLTSQRLSRDQLEVVAENGAVTLTNCGKGDLLVDGRPASEVALAEGQVIEVVDRLTVVVERRPARFEVWPGASAHAFGEADQDGLVGESAAAWEVRRQLDFLGPRRAHVLVRGPSGAGKELFAAGLHRRAGRPGALVCRNASTLPEGLVDAELFGNVRGYPNAGMPARPGLVGAAERGTLFLDEIGDLPPAVQPHLLRVLDDGDYQVLGDHTSRKADLRLVGATHRPAEQLRHDLLARFPLRVTLPGLDERRADLPLLARHLLGRILAREPDLAARFLDGAGRPRVAQGLVRRLLHHPFTTHVRELDALLWRALQSSRRDVVEDVIQEVHTAAAPAVAAGADWRVYVGHPPAEIPPAAIEQALAAHNGHQEQTAAALGLSSRFVLVRLLKQHGLSVVRRA